MAQPHPLYAMTMPGHQIRLLEILPSKNHDKQYILCKLQQFDVEHAPSYEALSYCWGDATIRANIMLDAQETSVTKSLHDALSILQKPDQPRMLWVDALCINQANDAEKSIHVPLMGRIYSHARRVTAWLGRCDSAMAHEIVRAIETITAAFRAYQLVHQLPEMSISESCKVKLPPDVHADMPWDAIAALLDSPWFRRIWCVQEIALASEGQVFWGEQAIMWESGVAVLIQWIASSVFADVGSIPKRVRWHFAGKMVANVVPQTCKLVGVLDRFRPFEATNPRDKVYGVLGLKELATANTLPTVDYAKSVGQIFADTARAIIAQTKDTLVLGYVSHPSEAFDGYHDHASWAPRWDVLSKHHVLHDETHSPRPPRKCIPLDMAMLDDADTDWTVLKLHGVQCDRVVRTWKPMRYRHFENWRAAQPVLQFWLDEISAEPPSSVDSPRLMALARTLTGSEVARIGRSDGNSNWGDASEAQVADHLQSFLSYINLLFSQYVRNGSEAVHSDVIARQYGPWEPFVHVFRLASSNRRLFKTASGCFGLGPHCLMEDDLVVELAGGRTPFVVRAEDRGHLFLGQVYIDELMDGEAVTMVERGELETTVFRLCK